MNNDFFRIGKNNIEENHPVFIIAEIGINHNGDLNTAKKLIDAASRAGCDAVKFQKRTPELCVPENKKNVPRETPWGTINYIDYRHKVEFDEHQYLEIDKYCKQKNIAWFASCWDIPSVDFIEKFNTPCYKIPSAKITDKKLVKHIASKGKPVILSTGMSTMKEIRNVVDILGNIPLLIAHCTSSYPCKIDELNLNMIKTLKKEFNVPVGYSGHEVGLQTTYAAIALGACFIERHITLDRSMWGSDQAASIEPWGFMRLVRDIRIIEKAMGDGIKKVYESEIPTKNKLRK